MGSEIKERVNFDFIRYANVWEDADILCSALQPRENKTFLSIASSGDNCFSLIAEGAHVVGVDLNPAQLASVELKATAIKELSLLEVLRFLGINPSSKEERLRTYNLLCEHLTPAARTFWDTQTEAIQGGFIHYGKFEKYFQLFQKRILPFIHQKSTIEALFLSKTKEEREIFYQTTWNNWRWNLLFKLFFSRYVLGKFGRDPEFFKFVEGDVSSRLLERTRYAFTKLDPHCNPFLSYILRGNFISEEITYEDIENNSIRTAMLPRYLRPEIFPKVKSGISRLTLEQGPIEEIAMKHEKFDGYNLSDLFEYLSVENTNSIYETLLKQAKQGARFAYWNMLVPRNCPEHLKDKVTELKDLGKELFMQDKAFFYSAFIVDEVR